MESKANSNRPQRVEHQCPTPAAPTIQFQKECRPDTLLNSRPATTGTDDDHLKNAAKFTKKKVDDCRAEDVHHAPHRNPRWGRRTAIKVWSRRNCNRRRSSKGVAKTPRAKSHHTRSTISHQRRPKVRNYALTPLTLSGHSATLKHGIGESKTQLNLFFIYSCYCCCWFLEH